MQTAPTAQKVINGSSAASSAAKSSKSTFKLDRGLLVHMHDLMVRSRSLEERLIKMYKSNDGYFWLGGPGEEAFNVPLGMQILKGQGLDYDYLHLHYRSSGVLLALGADPIEMIRQMKNTATDPFSGGRNFSGHASRREWNLVPITSTIETQYLTAIGGGLALKKHGGKAITIVTGGDAGTAEGDFASCLVWATRPGNELPILIIVTNNGWGISTAGCTQHGEKNVADRGKAFGMQTKTINGNDLEESYFAIQEAMNYVRTERKPFLLEAKVSRMYGHSSASGANLVPTEVDPIAQFELKLAEAGIVSEADAKALKEKYDAEMFAKYRQVKTEPLPNGSTIYDNTYWQQKGKYW